MTDHRLDSIRMLKEDARAAMQVRNYAAALDALAEAVDGLLVLHANNDAQLPPDVVRSELADCFGILGNIHRRLGNPVEALAAYKRGAEYEDSACYNRTNAIILTLMVQPETLDAIRPSIREALAILQQQVRGAARDDWWTWSDLGLTHLLNGDHDSGRAAFTRFTETGADAAAVQSVARLLGTLHEATAPHDPEVAAALESARARLAGD